MRIQVHGWRHRRITQERQIWFENEQRAGFVATRECIDENHRIPPIKQCIRKIEGSNPEVSHLYILGKRTAQERLRDFNAKPVIAKKDVPDTGDKDSWIAS
jgi:hypothetical protein